MSKSKFIYPATLLCDFYKVSHREQYPANTEKIYSTWTPRTSRLDGIDKVVAFGFQAFIKEYLINYFNENFFQRLPSEVIEEYKRVIKATLGIEEPYTEHIRELHELGYLPLKIKAVKEGTRVPIKVPMLTVENTHPNFYWVTNYIETLMSTSLWQISTNATIAAKYKEILSLYAEKTGGAKEFVQFQGHDFSMRGQSSLESAKKSGAGHLLSFVGTDTIPAILFLEEFYGADIEKELVGTSIPATEHSVMCAGGQESELETYKRIITEVYPAGFVSIVSDTWDLWKVLSDIIKPLKDTITARDGKVVIRPDSGDPIKIVTGYEVQDYDTAQFPREGTAVLKNGKYYEVRVVNGLTGDWDTGRELSPAEVKGVIQILWEIFGGITNAKGYKELDPHIGCIYGDAITLERCEIICKRLEANGFASTNMVYGIGSYTYQYNTRDTFGFALKSTYAKVNGKEQFLLKDPVTDRGTKKSASGMVAVFEEDGEIVLSEGWQERQLAEIQKSRTNLLEEVFVDGKLVREEKLSEIRARL